jgi:putative membrane protein
MTIRWLFAALHLLALGVGLGAIWGRRLALLGTLDLKGLKRLFHEDTWWGVAALLWIATGLTRAFGGLEKGSYYYLHNTLFLMKMACLVAILGLEVWPMTTLIRWRVQVAKGAIPETSRARAMADISAVQAGLVVVMVLLATAMARGLGFRAH